MSVYITSRNGSSRSSYHTKKNCQYIRDKDVKETTEAKAKHRGLKLCKRCDNGYTNNQIQDKSIYEAAKNAEVDVW